MSGCGSNKRNDGRTDLDAFAVLRRRKGARVWQAFWRCFASSVFVSVEVVDVDGLEGINVAFTHRNVREAVEPGVI